MRCALVLLCVLWCLIYLGDCLQKVTEETLLDLLTPSEKLLIFGPNLNEEGFKYKIITFDFSTSRKKRSVNIQNDKQLVIKVSSTNGSDADDEVLKLDLMPNKKLLDPHFVFIERWQNRSTILDSQAVDDSCNYRGNGVAVSLCGGNVRGIINGRNHHKTIHPLPKRFHSDVHKPHVIIKREIIRNSESLQSCTHNHDHNEKATYKSPSKDFVWSKHHKRKTKENHKQNDIANDKQGDQQHIGKYQNLNASDSLDLRKKLNKSEILVKEIIGSISDKSAIKTFNNNKSNKLNSINNNFNTANGSKENNTFNLKVHDNKRLFLQNATFKSRQKRATLSPGVPVHVETAVFVDRDLYEHMESNYPEDTEREIIRFVLAMINAVQLLYHDTSLGRPVNFVLKRLEVLREEPVALRRPLDIDRFLGSFCAWQRALNPPRDTDPAHWDHALILTGLDLYVVSKHGKVSSQVVGLAPVAGMCTATSSCTVNEGRHFESVYVVAHEIGHNLGMRHDGPLADNDCDPSSFIMSPTLGSGKITWSACSKRYLQKFLDTPQSRCLLDHGSSAGQLDHSAEGALPGERFDADQQCMLKYGKGSRHSLQQPLDDVCRDLHCQRERYTWTSHPALEGTLCGNNMWCRGGRCINRSTSSALRALTGSATTNSGVDSSSVTATPVDGAWTAWRAASDCASGCLFGDEGRLRSGSTGVVVAARRCDNPRPENGGRDCPGPARRHEACIATQCITAPRMTLTEFANQICGRAREVDSDLIGNGLQRRDVDGDEACMVWCHKRGGGTKTRGWTFPDGTVCYKRQRKAGIASYCIDGHCEEFGCDRSGDSEFVNFPEACPDISSISRRRGESIIFKWASASSCHSHCIAPGMGLRLVIGKSERGGLRKTSIQLCQPDKHSCSRLKTPFQHATAVCTKYKERVRRLSGLGMQISPVVEDPDRPCRVACQDENVSHRFYLVNGEEGWFPFGTDCGRGSSDKKAYCISGKCLEFGSDDTPLSEHEFTLPLLSRNKRSLDKNTTRIIATLEEAELALLISKLNLTFSNPKDIFKPSKYDFDISLSEPVYVTMETPIDILPSNYRDYYNDIYGFL